MIKKGSPPFKPARFVMSMVRRISIAFLEFADSSSSPSGQGMSKMFVSEVVKEAFKAPHWHQFIYQKRTAESICNVKHADYQIKASCQLNISDYFCGLGLVAHTVKQTHLCWEYSGRPAEASHRWKVEHRWGTRTDTRRAPTNPPWSLDGSKEASSHTAAGFKRHIFHCDSC